MLKISPHETIILNALRKASREGEFVVKCRTASEARSGRVQAYNLIKKIRTHVEKNPTEVMGREVLEYADEVSISVSEERLTMKRKDQNSSILAMQEALAASGEDVQEIEDPEIRAMMERAMKKIAEGGAA